MSARPALVILAAGDGSRYGGLKALAPVGPNGEALLEYSAFGAAEAGFGRVVLVVRCEHEAAFRDRLEGGLGRRLPLSFAHQEPVDSMPERRRPWGTGHAVLAARGAIDGPFAVVNADDLFDVPSLERLARFLAAPADLILAMVGFEVAATLSDSGPVSRALCRLDDDGFLREIVELEGVRRLDGRIVFGPEEAPRELEGEAIVSMNLWGFRPAVLAELSNGFEAFLAHHRGDERAEFYLPAAIDELVRSDLARVRVLRGGGGWCGITFRDDRERVASRLSEQIGRGVYPRELWAAE